MIDDIFISIIIPAYNEAAWIGETLESVAANFKVSGLSCEVIVIDDGSEDKTFAAAERCRNLFSNFRVLRNEKNKGKGYSVRRGMLEAEGKLGLFMDADNSVRIEHLDQFLIEMEKGADIVIGSIEIKGAFHKDENPGYRRFFGKLSKILIRMIAVPGIYDTQRGFKLFSEKAMKTVFSRQTIDRWGFDIELLVIARAHGLKIKEVPVHWMNKPTSSLGILAYPKTFFELIAIKANLLQGKYK